MLVVTRFRSDAELDGALQQLVGLLADCPGCTSAEIGRNLDEADLWLLLTRWQDVGSYRRALSTYDVKLAMQPLMSAMVDEPSAYEQQDREGAAVWNTNIPR